MRDPLAIYAADLSEALAAGDWDGAQIAADCIVIVNRRMRRDGK